MEELAAGKARHVVEIRGKGVGDQGLVPTVYWAPRQTMVPSWSEA
jgi:hypothetical protein